VLDEQLWSGPSVQSHIRVFESVHVQKHGVVAAIGLEYPSHRRGRRIGEYGVHQEALPCMLLQRRAGANRAEPSVLGTGPIPGSPATDESAWDRQSRPLIEFNDGHAVLASVFDLREQPVVHFRPGLHLNRAVVQYNDRRQAWLKLAEHDAVFNEAIVTSMILQSEVPVLERTMCALESTGEGGHRPAAIFRIDETGRNKGCNAADPVRPWQHGIPDLLLNMVRPCHSRMLRAERVTQLESSQIESDQITQGRRFNGVQLVHQFHVAPEKSRIDQVGLNDAHIDPRHSIGRIPRARAHGIGGIDRQVDSEIAGCQRAIQVPSVYQGTERNIIGWMSGRRIFSRLSLRLNPPGFTIQISHEMVKQHDDLLAAPNLIPEEICCGFDGRAMTGRGVAQVDARIAQRRIDQLRASGLVQARSRKVARISMAPLLDPESRRRALIQEQPSGTRTWVFQMIGHSRGAVPPFELEHVPHVGCRV
jgi:hypothetical protein